MRDYARSLADPGNRARRRLPKPRPAPSPIPHVCFVLGIDPGETSGVALGFAGRLQWARTVTTYAERRAAFQSAFAAAFGADLPLVIVAEKWRRGGKWGFQQSVGLGAQWGKWLAALEEFETYAIGRSRYPKLVRVFPDMWRGALLGNARLRTEQAKAAALLRVRAELLGVSDHNAAEAACIALWGLHAGEVRAVLPKKRKGD